MNSLKCQNRARDRKGRRKARNLISTVVADPRRAKFKFVSCSELFKVTVLRVNTLNVRGQDRRQRTAQAGDRTEEAVVTLKQGDKISLT
jgi:hypothetical protein